MQRMTNRPPRSAFLESESAAGDAPCTASAVGTLGPKSRRRECDRLPYIEEPLRKLAALRSGLCRIPRVSRHRSACSTSAISRIELRTREAAELGLQENREARASL